MKTSYVVFFLLFTTFSFGQLTENFNDGNFISNPEWLGDTAFYKINASKELQSRGPSSGGIISICTPNNRLVNTEWNFYVRMSFSPSTTNYCKFYLASDQQDLEGSLNGYYIKVGGESGTADGIDLYRQSGLTSTKIIDGIAGHAGKSGNTIRIKVIRDAKGNWQLYSDITGGINFLPEGGTTDTAFSYSSFCGIACIHSSTRKDQFFFDDIIIKEAPLSVINIVSENDSVLVVHFNKEVTLPSAENISNYFISTIGNPAAALLIPGEPEKVKLWLNQKLQSGHSYSLILNNIQDTSGTSITSGSAYDFIYKRSLDYAGILITEIFCDPSPAIGLPMEEYVELYNNTADTIDLNGFSLNDPSQSAILPFIKLNPFSYLILTSSSAQNEFLSYGNVVGLSNFPSLNNSGDDLYFKDNHGKIIFHINYTDDWYQDKNKIEGGWSLEMINPSQYCGEASNWSASADLSGGSPGRQNSIFSAIPDTLGPELISVELTDSLHLNLVFDENMDTSNHTIILGGLINADTVIFTDSKKIQVLFSAPLEENSVYEFTLENATDCKGNPITKKPFSIVRPAPANLSDLIINEILFNPRSGGVDFVEIYNRTDKYIDLKNWKLSNRENDTLNDITEIMNTSLIIPPYQYLAFTEDAAILELHYFIPYPHRILSINSLPSFPDEKGTVLLLNSQNEIADRFDYNEDMHYPLLDNKEGVSLERISPYITTNIPDNWHSAASTAGFATPGYENSQNTDRSGNKQINIEPAVFTPDQDGNNDMAFINYMFDRGGNLCNVKIFDVQGRSIRNLIKNELIGQEGFFQWDGTDDNGRKLNTGYYIVVLEIFDSAGKSQSYKLPVVLASHFSK
ncbi:MAG: lamin tail domain-containing protein [Cytophagaceae bacterium]|nr:lamin tail domain-containing protein [Cytophagaceae bacterium]